MAGNIATTEHVVWELGRPQRSRWQFNVEGHFRSSCLKGDLLPEPLGEMFNAVPDLIVRVLRPEVWVHRLVFDEVALAAVHRPVLVQ